MLIMDTPTLTYSEFSGTPFQIGFASGQYGASAFHTTIYESKIWEQLREHSDSEVLEALQTATQQHFPHIWDELQGLAKGLEAPFDDVFLWNCKGEFLADIPYHSATLAQITDTKPRITQSINADTRLAKHCTLAIITPDLEPAFATLVIPGNLAGNYAGVSEHGLAIAINPIAMSQPQAGVPSAVLGRALFNQSDLSKTIKLINQTERAGACHIVLSQQGSKTALSIEFNGSEFIATPIQSLLLHTNHLTDVSRGAAGQSVADKAQSTRRLQHLQAFAESMDVSDPLAILAKAEAEELEAVPTATRQFFATVDCQITADEVVWDVYDHPTGAARFRMTNAHHL